MYIAREIAIFLFLSLLFTIFVNARFDCVEVKLWFVGKIMDDEKFRFIARDNIIKIIFHGITYNT